MEWFYAAGDKQNGPVSDEDFKKLAAEGTIRPETLVWRAGMANWLSYRDATATASPASEPPLQLASAPAAAAPGSAPAAGSVVCRECGQIFPPEDVVKLGDAFICATCKPIYVQRLREGGLQPGAMDYAGFWIRLGAWLIDVILLQVINFGMALLSGIGFSGAVGINQGQLPPEQFLALQLGLMAVQLLIAISYQTFMTGRFGATLGKMACRLKVVTANGERVSYGRALGRAFASILSGIICYIGYIMAAFDDQKRALHDHICNTRVIRN